jgi:hypothetical protein
MVGIPDRPGSGGGTVPFPLKEGERNGLRLLLSGDVANRWMCG